MGKVNRKMVKATTIIVLFSGLFLLSGFIMREKNPLPMISKVQEYLNKNVSPVMKPYRVNFDKSLTNTEISQIEGIRKELKSIIETRKNAGVPVGSGNILNSTLTDSQVTVAKETRKRTYKVMLQAMIIANNHEKEIQNIFQNEHVNCNKWSDDIQKIIMENGNKRLKEMNPIAKQNIQRLLPMENLANVMFVIWKPDEPLFKNLYI